MQYLREFPAVADEIEKVCQESCLFAVFLVVKDPRVEKFLFSVASSYAKRILVVRFVKIFLYHIVGMWESIN